MDTLTGHWDRYIMQGFVKNSPDIAEFVLEEHNYINLDRVRDVLRHCPRLTTL